MTTNTQLQTHFHEPPTSDEMLAYQRGEMSDEERARFRDRLIEYPELVRTLLAPFPEAAEPGDDDYMSDAEFDRHFAAMQKRMPRGALVHFWPAMTAIAATLALVFGALLWQSQMKQRMPHVSVVEDDYIMSGPTRGAEEEPKMIQARGGEYVIVPVIMDQRLFETYRIEMRDTGVTPPRSLWSMAGFRRTHDSTVIVTVPRAFLGPGTYQLVLSGTLGAHEEPIGTYSIRIPEGR